MLALFAFTIGTSQILAPYELAAGLPYPVAAGVVQLHRSVAFVMVGVCVAVAALSVIWSFRPMAPTATKTPLARSLSSFPRANAPHWESSTPKLDLTRSAV